MKTLLIAAFFSCIRFAANGQNEFHFDDDLSYATVSDTDGFVNIRMVPNKSSTIIGKIYNYHIFSCEPSKNNWWKVLFIAYNSKNKSQWVEGYVHKSRIILLKKWNTIEAQNAHLDSCVFNKESLAITIKKGKFNPKTHKLLYEANELVYIDGKVFWGTDGKIPKEKIEGLKITLDKKVIKIPLNAFNDLYEPLFKSVEVCYGPGNTLYISMLNSDGAGAYTVIWVVKNNRYFTRYVDDSLD